MQNVTIAVAHAVRLTFCMTYMQNVRRTPGSAAEMTFCMVPARVRTT
jgi:hypothetical protein